MFDELPLWSAPFGLRLLETVRYRAGIRALDVGPGFGFPLLELGMRLGKTSTVVGIDPCTEGLLKIGKKIVAFGVRNVAILEGYAEHLPFARNTFDLITSNNGLNNVREPRTAFAELARVAKPGTQLVFTFNTAMTFAEFYGVYREVLYELGLPEFNRQLRDHISEKRKPLEFMKQLVLKSGFEIESILDDKFTYVFADPAAMFHHSFFRVAFLDAWKEIVPPPHRKNVLHEIEKKLGERARRAGELRMEVPFVTFDCIKA